MPGLFRWSTLSVINAMMMKSIIYIDNFICKIPPLLKFCSPEIALKRNFFARPYAAYYPGSLPTFGGQALTDEGRAAGKTLRKQACGIDHAPIGRNRRNRLALLQRAE